MIALMMLSGAPAGGVEKNRRSGRLTIVFDNVPFHGELKTGWGFSCLVEGFDRLLLFDTGSDGGILLGNLKKLGLDAGKIEAVFLSHGHGDHVGGLDALLGVNPGIAVFCPASFPSGFQQSMKDRGVSMKLVRDPECLFEKVHSTGEMGAGIAEQGLVLETGDGLVLVTGCAHPGIAEMVAKTQAHFRRPVRCIVGGFHLQGAGRKQIEGVARELMRLGVRGVAPSHCTGEAARSLFRHMWKNGFVESGVGASIELP